MAKHDFKTAESNYFSTFLSEQIWVSHWHISVGVNLAVMGTHDKDFGPAYCLNTMRIWIPIQILASNFDTLRMFKHSGFQKAQLFKYRMFIQKDCCKKKNRFDSKPRFFRGGFRTGTKMRPRLRLHWYGGFRLTVRWDWYQIRIPAKTQNTILKPISVRKKWKDRNL